MAGLQLQHHMHHHERVAVMRFVGGTGVRALAKILRNKSCRES